MWNSKPSTPNLELQQHSARFIRRQLVTFVFQNHHFSKSSNYLKVATGDPLNHRSIQFYRYSGPYSKG